MGSGAFESEWVRVSGGCESGGGGGRVSGGCESE